ncbi:MAG: T9SS type A sorting domain-containing protein [Bacteroidota bacterium]
MKKLLLSLMIAVAGNTTAIAQHSDTLNPVADVYLVTYGGGLGKNTLMKFDISAVPDNAVVSDAYLEVYVGLVGINWDGDIKLMNVNSQGWLESDQETTLWNLIRTDTIIQLIGFGTTAGWTSSVDIKQIFNRDYNQGNSFCTIQLKDPDDPTMAPAMGNPANDSNDSLMSGNIFNDFITFPPHEYIDPSLIPRLIVNYTIAPEIFMQPMNGTTCEGNNTMFNVLASGDALTYQWQLNGSDILGATSSSLSINPVTLGDAGNYQCIVSNAVGDDTSNIAVLTVYPLPVAYNLTGGGSYCEDGSGLSVGLSGSEIGIDYYLFCGGNYTGVTVAGTGAAINFGIFTDSCCYTAYGQNTTTFCQRNMTGNVCITINQNPSVSVSAVPDTICQGDCSTISVSVNSGCAPYLYLWNTGETVQVIIVCPFTTSSYNLTVVDCNGCTTSGSVEVFVDPCTGISEHSNVVNIQFTPNPFSNSAEIVSDKNFNNAELKIFDVLGNIVKRIKNISGNTIYINRQGLSDGMYFYKLSEKDIVIASGKFILN